MTREEIIDGLKFTVAMFLLDPSTGETITEPRNDMDKTTIDACKGAIELLEQEPCEDEYIKVPKKALKYRTAGMVAYNAEWLKNHFDIERVVICGEQEPCEDAISRQAVLSKKIYTETEEGWSGYTVDADYIEHLPSVRPQEPKTGHWEEVGEEYIQVYDLNGIPSCGDERICSECGFETVFIGEHCSQYKFCPNCGAKMVESKESDHTCHTCKHYTSGERDGSCGSYICKGYSNWESEE